MDPKIKKGLRLAAAAIFVFALALNIKITLDGPFLMMSDKAVASTTSNSSGGSSSSGGASWRTDLIPKCIWRTVTFSVGYDGKIIDGSVKWTKHKCTNCAYICAATQVGGCSAPKVCPISDTLPE